MYEVYYYLTTPEEEKSKNLNLVNLIYKGKKLARHYNSLPQLIEVLNRCGFLEDVENGDLFVTMAEQSTAIRAVDFKELRVG